MCIVWLYTTTEGAEMSVTFGHTAEPVISGWTNDCGCGAWRSEEFPSYEAAVAGNRNGCTDEFCASYHAFATPVYVGVEPISANFSNTNARHILTMLGVYDGELCGGMSVDDFERALVLAEPTAGIPDRTTVSVGGEHVTVEGRVDVSGGAFIECGRDAGYDTRALDALREVVAQARELHAEEITWA